MMRRWHLFVALFDQFARTLDSTYRRPTETQMIAAAVLAYGLLATLAALALASGQVIVGGILAAILLLSVPADRP